MKTQLGWGRKATYAALASMALILGAVAPAQAAVSVSVGGTTALKVTATARTTDTSFGINQKLGARAIVSYKALILGLPVPLTAAYINSIPKTFGRPTVTDVKVADLDSWTYRSMRDPWLKTDQWVVKGDKGFWGQLSVQIRGDARAKSKGSRYFHAGSGVGHAIDANSALRLTVK